MANWHIVESGKGPATVVLEAGIAATSLSWTLVQREVARFARVVSYDRAGLGWSDPASCARNPVHIATELKQLLKAAKIRPPFILVGHSFGGLVAAQYAINHPRDLAGLVLVDALSPNEFFPLEPEQAARLKRGVALSKRGATLARWGVVRWCLDRVLNGDRIIATLAALISSGEAGKSLTSRLAAEIQKLPEDTWPMIASLWSAPKSFDAMVQHLESIPETCASMAGAKLPKIPITVLLAGSNKYGHGLTLPSTASVIKVDSSGHWIHLDEPELVVEAIRELAQKTTAPGGSPA